MPRRRPIAAAFALPLAVLAACGDPAPPGTVPVYPGSIPRPAEARFQERLLAALAGGGIAPDVAVYETPASFASVVEFYEPWVQGRKLEVNRFQAGPRLRAIGDGVRQGAPQPLAVAELVFGAAAPDSASRAALADSFAAFADRVGEVSGLTAHGRVPLAGAPPGSALVAVERPHLDVGARAVDSVTVVTIVRER
jgi:hypothetical protein